MESLSNFLKVSLYRVIFVLLVGIPALEFFSYNVFNTFIAFKVEDINNSKLNANIYLKLDKLKLDSNPYHIPGSIKIPQSSIKETTIHIKNAEFKIQNDPILRIENSYMYKLRIGRKYKLISIREIPLLGWIIYLSSAFIVGEILCFLGELFIGVILFGWNPFSENENVEYIIPGISLNRKELKISDIANSKNFEISEVHYNVSRIFSGLLILLILILIKIFPITLTKFLPKVFPAVNFIIDKILNIVIISSSLAILLLGITFLAERDKDLISTLISTDKNAIPLFGSVFLRISFLLLLSLPLFIHILKIFYLLFILLLIAVTYRTHANKILKYTSENRDNKSSNNENQ